MCGHERHHDRHGCGCEQHEHQPDCGCEGQHQHHGRHGERGCRCEERHAEPGPTIGGGFGRERGFQRRFLTRAEQAGHLDVYLQALKTEVLAVEQQLAAFRTEGA